MARPGRRYPPRTLVRRVTILATPSTPTRAFASGDSVTLSVGGLAGAGTGALTYAAIVKRTSSADQLIVGFKDSAGALQSGLVINGAADSNQVGLQGNTGGALAAISFATTDDWVLVAITKATGTTAPRGHKYLYSTPTWTHTDSAATVANQSSISGGSVRIGASGAASYNTALTGDIAVVGVWDGTALSDANIETLELDLQSWMNLSPTALWRLDQASTSTNINDLTAGGSNQTALSGTSIDLSTPPGFDWALTGGTNYAQTVTDPVGLLDSQTQATAAAQSQTDAIGLADTAGQAATFTQSTADAVGLVDAATYDKGVLLTVTDPVGLLDTSSQQAAFARQTTDPVSALDAASQIASFAQAAIDPVGIGDSQSQSVSGSTSQTITDVVGLLDSAAQIATAVQATTDAIGLLDSEAEQLDRPLTDPVGLLDSQARLAATTAAFTDSIGFLDAAAQATATAQALTDPVGITDGRTQDATGPNTQIHTNPIGILDAINVALVNVAPHWVEASGGLTGTTDGSGGATGLLEGGGVLVGVVEGSSGI